MKGNDFDKIIGEKLNEYREQPSPALFSRIEESLGNEVPRAPARKKSRGALFFIARIGGAAAVLAGLVLGYTLFHDNPGDPANNNVAIAEVTEPSPGNTQAAEITVENEIPEPVEPAGRNGRVKENMPITEELRKMIEEDLRAAQETTGKVNGSLTADGKNITTSPDTGMPRGKTDPDGPALIIPDSGPYRDSDKTSAEDLRQPIDTYWEELLRKEETPKRKKGKISGSIYAGNFGAGTGNYYSLDPKDLIVNQMTVMGTSGMDNEGGSTMLDSPGKAPPDPASVPEPKTELKHRMPVNYGLSFGIPLTERLTLISGLNYSYLSSHSSQSTGKTDRANTLSRQIHYVGIPLGVSYSFYNTKNISLYVTGGGMLEKAVYAREVTTYAFDSGDTEKSQRIKVKGVSPSVRGAVGVSLRLGSGITLYVEPGVAYYFERVNSLPSYRTEYPVNFSLTAGIRFGI